MDLESRIADKEMRGKRRLRAAKERLQGEESPGKVKGNYNPFHYEWKSGPRQAEYYNLGLDGKFDLKPYSLRPTPTWRRDSLAALPRKRKPEKRIRGYRYSKRRNQWFDHHGSQKPIRNMEQFLDALEEVFVGKRHIGYYTWNTKLGDYFSPFFCAAQDEGAQQIDAAYDSLRQAGVIDNRTWTWNREKVKDAVYGIVNTGLRKKVQTVVNNILSGNLKINYEEVQKLKAKGGDLWERFIKIVPALQEKSDAAGENFLPTLETSVSSRPERIMYVTQALLGRDGISSEIDPETRIMVTYAHRIGYTIFVNPDKRTKKPERLKPGDYHVRPHYSGNQLRNLAEAIVDGKPPALRRELERISHGNA